MPRLALKTYELSPKTGFLSAFDAATIELSGNIHTAAHIAMSLPDRLPTGRVRELLLRDLPAISRDELEALSDHEARKAITHYAFMAQAWVWGERTAPDHIPRQIAVPLTALADRVGQPPLLTYSQYVLDNWSCFDTHKPVTLDNAYMIQNFLSGLDEAWFVLVHVAIEAQAGRVLACVPDILESTAARDIAETRRHLEIMAEAWEGVNAIFHQMPDGCDPYIYFQRVRPYIHGWKDNPALPNGLIYEGVEKFAGKGQAFRGQTGSQSSIVPTMDSLMGVGHAADPLRAYLDELHIYRLPVHRRFIEDVRQASDLRAFVVRSGDAGLADAYNANLQAVTDFRTQHLEYAASYINKQGKTATGNDNEVGTGGTPFMRYLKKHRDETEANLVRITTPAI